LQHLLLLTGQAKQQLFTPVTVVQRMSKLGQRLRPQSISFVTSAASARCSNAEKSS
jgi:hypothetical protein